MDDFCAQIPACAFYNMQVLYEATDSGDLKGSIHKWSQRCGIPDLSIMNPACVASLLYCLIVVPKEVWDVPSEASLYSDLEREKPFALFHFTTGQQPRNREHCRTFLRRLRNAVAHVRFKVAANWSFEFWDKPPRAREVDFRVSIGRDNLARFLSVVGARLANLRNR